MKKILALLLSLILFALMLAGCATGDDSKSGEIRPVKIAILEPFSGTNAFAGQLNLEGMQLAVDLCNASGGIKSLGGAPVEIVIGDVTSDPSESKTVAERVLVDEDIVAVFGSISSVVVPYLPVIEKLGIPTLTGAGSAGIVDEGYQYIFRPVSSGADFGQINVEFLDFLSKEGELDSNKIAIISEDSAWGISNAEGVRNNAAKFGLEVVMDEYFASGFTDASSLIIQLQASGADAVICNSYLQETKLIVSTMKSMGADDILICGGGSGFLLDEFGKGMGDDVNGITSASHCSPDVVSIVNNPKFSGIPDKFREKYGTFMNQFSLNAYSIGQLIIEALEVSGSRDRTQLRDVLRANEWEIFHPYGICKFDETGANTNVTPIIVQWQDGEPRGIYPYDVCTYEYQKPGEMN
jgi:ABC-type branched-chain amino acid transport systems, periplasmic component